MEHGDGLAVPGDAVPGRHLAAALIGLLYVLSEPGEVPLDEFHRWYDTEHAPARLRVPGVHGGHRFRAADERTPGWLAVYLPMLRRVPGWLRTVRYRLAEGAGPDRLAVHELAGPAVFETPQYARAVSTPWRDAVASTIRARERRLFTHHRTLG